MMLIDAHNADVLASESGAFNYGIPSVCRNGNRDRIGEVGARIALRLRDRNPALFHQKRCVHVVHVRQYRCEHPLLQGDGYGCNLLLLKERAAIVNLHRRDLPLNNLRVETSKPFGKCQIRPQNIKRSRVDFRLIHGVGDRAAAERVRHLLCDFNSDVFLCLRC